MIGRINEQPNVTPIVRKESDGIRPEVESAVGEVLLLAGKTENVHQKLRALKYVFAERGFRESGVDDQGIPKRFSTCILKGTDEVRSLRELEYVRRAHASEMVAEGNFEHPETDFTRGLNAAYASGGLESAFAFANGFFGKIEDGSLQEEFTGLKKAGLIEFGDVTTDGENMNFLQIHFPILAERRQETLSSYEQSLEELARQLIGAGTYVDYIRRRSWMADMEKSVGYGFRKVGSEPFDPTSGLSVWGQFIGRDGGLNTEAMRYLFENGRPRYEEVTAVMDFRDLVCRYVPELRGREIEMHRTSPSVSDDVRVFDRMRTGIASIFDSCDSDEILAWLRNSRIWEYIFASEIGDDVTAFIRRVKSEGKSFQEVKDSGGLDELNERAEEIVTRFRDSFEDEKISVKIPEQVEN